jgi:WD40-like Beta Propeller Repeat
VNSSGVEGNDASRELSISADGRYVGFRSDADNLVPGDTNSARDIFVHDRQTDVTERVSVSSLGVEGSSWSESPSISADGRHVAFSSGASNLVPGSQGGSASFVHDRLTRVTERVSVSSLGIPGNDSCVYPSISADGRHVAFDSLANNLVPGGSGREWDVFVHDRWDGLGANSIYLTGPTTAPVGFPLELSWAAARPNSKYGLAYSLNTNHGYYGGHLIDLSAPRTALAIGVNSGSGMGSYTSGPVRIGAAGITVYFEVVAQDANGVIYDSNVHAITFQ